MLALAAACTLLSDDDRPRLSASWEVALGDRRPKNMRGDHWLFSGGGETDRAVRCLVRIEVEVCNRISLGGGGGARGVMNLSAGFIVLISPLAIELIDALRNRNGWTSTGTQRRLTGWPGR